MRFLKLVYYTIKQTHSKWSLAFEIGMFALISANTLWEVYHNPQQGTASLPMSVPFVLLSLYLGFSIVAIFGGITASKQDLDFVFATPVDPRAVHLAKVLSASIDLALFYFIVSFPVMALNFSPVGLLFYLATWLSLSFTSAFAVLTASYLSSRLARVFYVGILPALVLLLLVAPEMSPFRGLYYPSPLHALEAIMLTVAYLATAPYKRIEEVATNAYGILAKEQALRLGGRGERPQALPKTFWGVIWHTSVNAVVDVYYTSPEGSIVRREKSFNVLKTFMPISAAAAAVYAFLSTAHITSGVDLSIAGFIVVNFLLLFVFSALHQAVAHERLWISVLSGGLKYLRYRMAARTIITALLLVPWIAVFLAQSAVFPPSAFLAVVLASAALVAPSATWLMASVKPPPQIRELEIPITTPKLSLWNILQLLAALLYYSFSLSPYALAVVAYFLKLEFLWQIALIDAAVVLSLSAAFFYVVVLSERGAPLWSWAVSKLSENGYV
ncbi:hypothetical protein Pisl_0090 [Pyrobaculum islandicum DSM 4184]|uniref:ABC-2 type transport system permease protein n=1 Tax=Pyrobaculum islandicum (strain DSM 4184 / JCM 9189 / GEO3) TaxID=384616 RepID=A1RQP1_PYRIL|nr:hypothetical protein [Pyrobaculum islandicum]ABL87273.1 hypothetical protein Pisl_0090 [Pyrobaculum islandicum DSM 4184]